MPIDIVKHYNQIDIGIFLCFLELCLNKNNIKFERTLYVEENIDETIIKNDNLFFIAKYVKKSRSEG